MGTAVGVGQPCVPWEEVRRGAFLVVVEAG